MRWKYAGADVWWARRVNGELRFGRVFGFEGPPKLEALGWIAYAPGLSWPTREGEYGVAWEGPVRGVAVRVGSAVWSAIGDPGFNTLSDLIRKARGLVPDETIRVVEIAEVRAGIGGRWASCAGNEAEDERGINILRFTSAACPALVRVRILTREVTLRDDGMSVRVAAPGPGLEVCLDGQAVKWDERGWVQFVLKAPAYLHARVDRGDGYTINDIRSAGAWILPQGQEPPLRVTTSRR